MLPSSGATSFAVIDVLRDGLALAAGDCVIGLHACGELGDAIVESAPRAGDSVALVGCCLQKCCASSRTPLCSAPGLDDALELPRGLLGLSNLTARDEGVEASLADNLAARVRRFALARLVAADGAPWSPTHVEGISRRAAHGDSSRLAGRARLRAARPALPPARGHRGGRGLGARAAGAGAPPVLATAPAGAGARGPGAPRPRALPRAARLRGQPSARSSPRRCKRAQPRARGPPPGLAPGGLAGVRAFGPLVLARISA